MIFLKATKGAVSEAIYTFFLLFPEEKKAARFRLKGVEWAP